MAEFSPIIAKPSEFDPGEFWRSAAAWLDRAFVPRELILRASGQVSYLRLSSRVQKLVAAGAFALVAWGLFATVGSLVQRESLAERDRVITQQERAYLDLEQAYEQALANQSRLESEVAALGTSLGREIEINEVSRQNREALARRAEALSRSLVKLRQSHREVIDNFGALAIARAATIEDLVADTGLDEDWLGNSVQASNLAAGGPLIPVDVAIQGFEPRANLSLAVSALNRRWDRLLALQGILETLPLSAPLDEYWISSPHGERHDPLTGAKAHHSGLDLVAPLGSDILAAAPGRVVFAGTSQRYGHMVEIDHGHGIVTRYAHLRQVTVEEGEETYRGQKIGIMGSSGRSTGPHLHYEILSRGQDLDPMKFLEAGKSLTAVPG